MDDTQRDRQLNSASTGDIFVVLQWIAVLRKDLRNLRTTKLAHGKLRTENCARTTCARIICPRDNNSW